MFYRSLALLIQFSCPRRGMGTEYMESKSFSIVRNIEDHAICVMCDHAFYVTVDVQSTHRHNLLSLYEHA